MVSTLSKFVEYDKAAKRYRVAEKYRDRFPTWLTFERSDAKLPLSVAASGATTTGMFQPVHQQRFSTPFVGIYSTFADSTDLTPTSNVAVLIQDMASGRRYMNRAQHIRNIAGIAQNPFIFREPLIIPTYNQLKFEYYKITGGAVNFRHYLHGWRYFDRSGANDLKKMKDIENRVQIATPYFLSPETGTNAAPGAVVSGNATFMNSVKIGGGHFQMLGMTYVSTGTFTLEIIDVETRRTIMNGAMSAAGSIGTAKFPRLLDVPYTVPMGGQLRMTLVDTSGSSNTIYLCLFGRLIYVPLRDVEEAMKDTSYLLEDIFQL